MESPRFLQGPWTPTRTHLLIPDVRIAGMHRSMRPGRPQVLIAGGRGAGTVRSRGRKCVFRWFSSWTCRPRALNDSAFRVHPLANGHAFSSILIPGSQRAYAVRHRRLCGRREPDAPFPALGPGTADQAARQPAGSPVPYWTRLLRDSTPLDEPWTVRERTRHCCRRSGDARAETHNHLTAVQP